MMRLESKIPTVSVTASYKYFMSKKRKRHNDQIFNFNNTLLLSNTTGSF